MASLIQIGYEDVPQHPVPPSQRKKVPGHDIPVSGAAVNFLSEYGIASGSGNPMGDPIGYPTGRTGGQGSGKTGEPAKMQDEKWTEE